MKRIGFFLLAALAALPLSAAEHRVLIATENTAFKKAFVRALAAELEDGNTEVVVIDHKKGELAGVDPRDYTAVFITNSGVQARVRPYITDWLASVAGHDGNVILHTTQITNWTPDVTVDSITSASQKSHIDELVAEVAGKIRQFY